jgi:hypothetical protein
VEERVIRQNQYKHIEVFKNTLLNEGGKAIVSCYNCGSEGHTGKVRNSVFFSSLTNYLL